MNTLYLKIMLKSSSLSRNLPKLKLDNLFLQNATASKFGASGQALARRPFRWYSFIFDEIILSAAAIISLIFSKDFRNQVSDKVDDFLPREWCVEHLYSLDALVGRGSTTKRERKATHISIQESFSCCSQENLEACFFSRA